MIFLGWIVFSLIVGMIGSDRNIGFGGAFFLSLLLSPIIGLIITLISKSKAAIVSEKRLLDTQREQNELLRDMSYEMSGEESQISIADEIEKLAALHASGVIDSLEFEQLKAKLIRE